MNSRQRKSVGYWLFLCAGMLTESGLSMVNWDLFRSMKPPLSQKEWEEEFERYKNYPEYKYKCSSEEMTLSQFKFIWHMEYGHRMWGRLTGVIFLLPCIYFWARGYFPATMKRRMVIAAALMLAQGGIGWWMVKSGLDPSHNSEASVPRVSQYRLATHLTIAFLLYSLFFYNGISHFIYPQAQVSNTLFTFYCRNMFFCDYSAGKTSKLSATSWVVAQLQSIGVFYRIYGSVCCWAGRWAYLTLLTITATWVVGCRAGLPRRARFVLHSTMAMGYIQAALGIYALLYYVPVWLGSLHQCGSMALLSFTLWLTNELRRVPK
ncbi:unnamed protein product [Strongylus vulgaris]|uniref:Cytochrome c oxidase assembly protein COX15 homolog n=1 Tax=Strongylus vulgaris TaxID=40348 RepID=A0A3P7I7J0_STRVU|nr:unnamed protein product [Strongylus vulgaris]